MSHNSAVILGEGDKNWREVEAERGDTVKKLARLRKLDPHEYTIWLRPLKEGDELPADADAVVPTGCKYKVPNLAIVVWGDGMEEQDRLSVWYLFRRDIMADLRYLRSEGYNVVSYKHPPKDWVKRKLRSEKLAVFIFGGHGTPASDILVNPKKVKSSDGYVKEGAVPEAFYRHGSHRLAILKLYACYSADTSVALLNKETFVRAAWVRNISPNGFFLGFEGSVDAWRYRSKMRTIHGYQLPPLSPPASQPPGTQPP